jgi:hypothetical protein
MCGATSTVKRASPPARLSFACLDQLICETWRVESAYTRQRCAIQCRQNYPPNGALAFIDVELFVRILDGLPTTCEPRLQGLGEPLIRLRFFDMVALPSHLLMGSAAQSKELESPNTSKHTTLYSMRVTCAEACLLSTT